MDKEEKLKTDRQFRAFHKGLSLHAKALTDAGWTIQKTLEGSVELPWTQTLLKELYWKPIQKAMTGKDSSKDLTTIELQEVWKIFSTNLSPKCGDIPFPSIEVEMMKTLTDVPYE